MHGITKEAKRKECQRDGLIPIDDLFGTAMIVKICIAIHLNTVIYFTRNFDIDRRMDTFVRLEYEVFGVHWNAAMLLLTVCISVLF